MKSSWIVMLIGFGIVSVTLGLLTWNRKTDAKTACETVLRFSYTRANRMLLVRQEADADLLRERAMVVRSLQDCFREWQYGSQIRSNPFYQKVIKIAGEKPVVVNANLSQEDLQSIVRSVRFEIDQASVKVFPVEGRVVICADNIRVAECIRDVYKECLSAYVEEENVMQKERATAALRGLLLSKEKNLSRLQSCLQGTNISPTDTIDLQNRIVMMKDEMKRILDQIKALERTALDYGRRIDFLENNCK